MFEHRRSELRDVADVTALLHVGAMYEPSFTAAEKIACVGIALVVATFGAWFWWTLVAMGHDKSLNGTLQSLWYDAQGLPLGTVVPAHNRWMEQAFVTDKSDIKLKKVRLLILDDHYWSRDPDYASESGVVGDTLSRSVLCSVPAQSRRYNVVIDPVVRSLLASECPGVR